MSSKQKHHLLSEFFATSIAGNDILSSALYVSGIAALFAGVYAPIILLAVAGVLFFYRAVYKEVVGALPVNGGAYNALLNGTSKTFAATAGVMTVLSYVATAVISAKTAVEYLFSFLERIFPSLHLFGYAIELSHWVLPVTAIILGLFAYLVVSGVKDSAKVAASIFVFHVVTLTVFIILSLIVISSHGSAIWQGNIAATTDLVTKQGGMLHMFFLAFSASLLGVSGFESSANFVEEQKPGVFPKTLRNMTIGVGIFNPLLAFVALNLLPLGAIILAKDFLLAEAAQQVGGIFLLGWIAIDAFLVLCGAVLTSYVGVSGLINRMSLDGCLPSLLNKTNKQQSHPRIIVSFFVLSCSILYVTNGDLLSLAGVYTISFLSVMTFFGISNLILRINRPDLKRPYHAPFLFVLIAILSTMIGVMGNISIDPRNTGFFLTYFIPAILLTFAVMFQKQFFASMMKATTWSKSLHRFFKRQYNATTKDRLYVFVHNVERIATVMEYIQNNEPGHNITLIHCRHAKHELPNQLPDIIEKMRLGGFFKHLNIVIDYIDAPFSPELVDAYARSQRIEKNKILIGSIHHHHEFNYEDLGGVRVIL